MIPFIFFFFFNPPIFTEDPPFRYRKNCNSRYSSILISCTVTRLPGGFPRGKCPVLHNLLALMPSAIDWPVSVCFAIPFLFAILLCWSIYDLWSMNANGFSLCNIKRNRSQYRHREWFSSTVHNSRQVSVLLRFCVLLKVPQLLDDLNNVTFLDRCGVQLTNNRNLNFLVSASLCVGAVRLLTAEHLQRMSPITRSQMP